MNLPLVFDIATGLIFIYLILSLLTSELQELLSTVLQWRADHLKKSIEVLLNGNNSDDPSEQQFANALYNTPLLQSLNQEAKGPIAKFFRSITQGIGRAYRNITSTRNVFYGQQSGPSYIPSESFAAALLQKLDLDAINQKISESSLKSFSREKIALLQEIIDAIRTSVGDDTLLESELTVLKRNLTDIYDDLINRRTTLAISIDNATRQLIQFVDNTSTALIEDERCQNIIRQRIPYLRQAIFLRKLEPTISEVVSMVLDNQQSIPPHLADIIERIRQENPNIPQHLKQNLLLLSQQAQLKAQGLEDGVRQLEKEVGNWFDRSMERASGVYKRNAKGVAILIGFIVAVATNTDTFHIVNRLSKDTVLRSTISQAANQVVAQTSQPSGRLSGINPTTLPPGNGSSDFTQQIPPTTETPGITSAEVPIQQDLEDVKTAVNNVLEGLPLPIGWNAININDQTAKEKGWPVPYLRRMLGWFISGIALSMGASFWFDLLGKVMRVRNSGKANDSNSNT
jgi:GTPase SAR1 family protein